MEQSIRNAKSLETQLEAARRERSVLRKQIEKFQEVSQAQTSELQQTRSQLDQVRRQQASLTPEGTAEKHALENARLSQDLNQTRQELLRSQQALNKLAQAYEELSMQNDQLDAHLVYLERAQQGISTSRAPQSDPETVVWPRIVEIVDGSSAGGGSPSLTVPTPNALVRTAPPRDQSPSSSALDQQAIKTLEDQLKSANEQVDEYGRQLSDLADQRNRDRQDFDTTLKERRDQIANLSKRLDDQRLKHNAEDRPALEARLAEMRSAMQEQANTLSLCQLALKRSKEDQAELRKSTTEKITAATARWQAADRALQESREESDKHSSAVRKYATQVESLQEEVCFSLPYPSVQS